MVPATEFVVKGISPGLVILKLVTVVVNGSIGSLNVALILALIATFAEPFVGVAKLTTGGIVSLPAPVIKEKMKLAAIGLPDRSLTPVVIVAV